MWWLIFTVYLQGVRITRETRIWARVWQCARRAWNEEGTILCGGWDAGPNKMEKQAEH